MNRREAAKVLAVLAAAYRTQLAEDNAEVWFHTALEKCEPPLGMAVAQRIIGEDRFFPTPARFNEVRRAIDRSREPVAIAESSTVVPLERIRQLLEQARAEIAEKRGPHNHKGPGPCPVCGGLPVVSTNRKPEAS